MSLPQSLREEVLITDAVRIVRGVPTEDLIVVGDDSGKTSRAMFHAHRGDRRVLTIESNQYACEMLEKILEPFGSRSVLRCERLSMFAEVAYEEGFTQVGGIVIDIGAFLEVLPGMDRGDVFQEGAFLDEVGDPELPTTPSDLVHGLSEPKLRELFLKMNDPLFGLHIAREIAEQRVKRDIETIKQLVNLISHSLREQPPEIRKDAVAQALIALAADVSMVEQSLITVLHDCPSVLAPDGILVVIALSSHQEGLVRAAISQSSRNWVEITETPIRPDPSKVAENRWMAFARLMAYRLAA